MTIPKITKQMQYERYAEYCLKAAPLATDREVRVILREMAAEWLKLAEKISHEI
jgi:hypothetical protein